MREQSHKEEMRAALQGDFARLRERQERTDRRPAERVDPPVPVPDPSPDPPVPPSPEPIPLPSPEPSPSPMPVPSPPSPEPVPSPDPSEPEPDETPELDPAASGLGARLRSLFGR